MKKRSLSILLTLAMAFAIVLALGLSASAVEWYTSGTGTETDPYIISNYDGLNGLATATSGDSTSTVGKYYKLSDDFPNGGSTSALTAPICGGDSGRFCGKFDGNGKTVVLNIVVNGSQAGMFPYTGDSRTKDITIKNLVITGSIELNTSAYNSHIGGIVGCAYWYTNIVNCGSTASVKIKSTSTGDGNVAIGSFAGTIDKYCSIENCYSTGVVSGVIGSAQTMKCRGMIGNYVDSDITITNCFYYEQYHTDSNGKTTKLDADKISSTAADGGLTFLNKYVIENSGKGYFGWDVVSGENNDYPVLVAIPVATTKCGTVEDVCFSIHDAITAAGENATTIMLLTDISDAGITSITIGVNQNITIDLNNHVLSASENSQTAIIVNNGTLTITDNSGVECNNYLAKNAKNSTVRYFTDSDGDGAFETLETSYDPTGKTEGTDYVKVVGGCITGGKKGVNEGYTTNYGAAIASYKALTISGGNIVGNMATFGGAICIKDGRFTMTDGTIVGNKATLGGGALASYVGEDVPELLISGGKICYNTSDNNGGAIYLDASFYSYNATISGGEIYNNKAVCYGGAAYFYGENCAVTVSGTAKIHHNSVNSENNDPAHGGAFYLSYGTLEMTGGSVYDNVALASNENYESYGGAISLWCATFKMSAGDISNNSSDYGGGVYLASSGYSYGESTMTMSGTAEIKGNTANEDGGGIYCTDGCCVELSGGTISNNKAEYSGGGIYDDCEAYFYSYSDYDIRYGVFIGGTVKVVDNTADGSVNNIYLPEDIYLAFSNPDVTKMKVGVTTEVDATEDTSVQVTIFDSNYGAYASCIVSDAGCATGTQDNYYSRTALFFTIPTEKMVATATGDEVIVDRNGVKYVMNNGIVRVDVSVIGTNFAGAEYALTYNTNQFKLMVFGTDGQLREAEATEAPDGFNKIDNGNGTATLVASAVIATKDQKDIPMMKGKYLFADGTVIGSIYFKAISGAEYQEATFPLTGRFAESAVEASACSDAPDAFCVAGELLIAPRFDVEIVKDYVSGKSLILLYTDSTLKFSYYNGIVNVDMPLLSDKTAKVNGVDTYYVYAGTDTKTTDGTYVYGVVATDTNTNSLVLATVKRGFTFEVADDAKTYTTLDFSNAGAESQGAKPQFNVNGSTNVDLYDAVAAAGTYNVAEAYFNDATGVCEQLNVILKSDVNRDKKVDMSDVSLILQNYGSVPV